MQAPANTAQFKTKKKKHKGTKGKKSSVKRTEEESKLNYQKKNRKKNRTDRRLLRKRIRKKSGI